MLLSQEEMASKLDVAFSTINRYENGHFNPTPKLQRKIKTLAINNKIDFNSYRE